MNNPYLNDNKWELTKVQLSMLAYYAQKRLKLLFGKQ